MRRGEQLSARQKDVADLKTQGLTNEEIGQKLAISPSTVKNHITHFNLKTRKPKPESAHLPFDYGVFNSLTEKERAILERLSQGMSNKEIGRDFDPALSDQTVKNHMTTIFLKLGTHSRTRVAALFVTAKERGLLTEPQSQNQSQRPVQVFPAVK